MECANRQNWRLNALFGAPFPNFSPVEKAWSKLKELVFSARRRCLPRGAAEGFDSCLQEGQRNVSLRFLSFLMFLLLKAQFACYCLELFRKQGTYGLPKLTDNNPQKGIEENEQISIEASEPPKY
jgi:hypothetical protein